jgi:rhamnulose-1-phosphate aldolase
MGGKKQSITTQQLKDLAARFDVKPMPEALAIEKWIS